MPLNGSVSVVLSSTVLIHNVRRNEGRMYGPWIVSLEIRTCMLAGISIRRSGAGNKTVPAESNCKLLVEYTDLAVSRTRLLKTASEDAPTLSDARISGFGAVHAAP
jgi:hypothetical protein